MITRMTLTLAIAAFAGMSTAAAFAQEHPPGSEGNQHAGGENREAHGPAHPGGVPAHGPQGPAMRPAPGPAVRQAPGPAMRPAPGPAVRPAPGPAMRPAPGPAVRQAPGPAMRPHQGPSNAPNVGEHRAPNMAPHAARAPIDHAPAAHGAVPGVYRGDIHRFNDQDAHVWRGGRWHHSHHGGRFGWWWVVGGLWYFYPQPVYPYPNPLVPGDVAGTGQYWYYCQSAGQYYPYVTYCPEGWQAVVPDQ
ncbi:hypothetical protein [Trinickia acidisoli]|uniref:hypothetical protein n=1 Tax=Trinickia acidisoli TaxID=2767482 RepID=UPI001A90787D|nr:hypothetical protein [Trinickia acidisoli]